MKGLSFLAKLRHRARDFRKHSTEAERVLWRELRSRRFRVLKFRRQQRVGPYILDFYCYDRKLAIEVDGGGHANPETRGYDVARAVFLSGAGIRIVRFWNNDVLKSLDSVLAEIDRVLIPPSP
ncbi:MAG: endonuclease domain-containing protein, partial [Thermoanaerobaculia bacterium]